MNRFLFSGKRHKEVLDAENLSPDAERIMGRFVCRGLCGETIWGRPAGNSMFPIQFGQQWCKKAEGEDIRGSPIEKPCRGDQNRLSEESRADPFMTLLLLGIILYPQS